MGLNNTKCLVLRFSYKNPVQHCRLGVEWLASCREEKDLREIREKFLLSDEVLEQAAQGGNRATITGGSQEKGR